MLFKYSTRPSKHNPTNNLNTHDSSWWHPSSHYTTKSQETDLQYIILVNCRNSLLQGLEYTIALLPTFLPHLSLTLYLSLPGVVDVRGVSKLPGMWNCFSQPFKSSGFGRFAHLNPFTCFVVVALSPFSLAAADLEPLRVVVVVIVLPRSPPSVTSPLPSTTPSPWSKEPPLKEPEAEWLGLGKFRSSMASFSSSAVKLDRLSMALLIRVEIELTSFAPSIHALKKLDHRATSIAGQPSNGGGGLVSA